MYISVLIPAYNEALRLPKTLEVVSQYLDMNWSNNWEIVVVNDGSTDNTLAAIEQFTKDHANVRVIGYSINQGKGKAIQTGVRECRGELILISDADSATPIKEFEKLNREIEAGADVAIGSRALPGSEVELPKREWYRDVLGRVSNLLIRIVLNIPFRDTQCGFKLFRKEVALELFRDLHLLRWSWDFEVLYRACYWGMKVREIPVEWHSMPGSKLKLLDFLACLPDLIKVRLLVIEKRNFKL